MVKIQKWYLYFWVFDVSDMVNIVIRTYNLYVQKQENDRLLCLINLKTSKTELFSVLFRILAFKRIFDQNPAYVDAHHLASLIKQLKLPITPPGGRFDCQSARQRAPGQSCVKKRIKNLISQAVQKSQYLASSTKMV